VIALRPPENLLRAILASSTAVLLVLAASAAPAEAAGVRVRWQHGTVSRFLVHVVQPGPAGAVSEEFVLEDLIADPSGIFVAELSVADPFAAVDVFVTAVDAVGGRSGPSNVLGVTAAELCGARDCDDGIDCTDDLCNASGRCVHVPDGGHCPDGEICTDDVCDPRLGCRWPTNRRECNDGRACTRLDTCFAGECAGGVDCPSGAICDGLTGFCRRAPPPAIPSTPAAPDGCGDGALGEDEACDDGDSSWSAGRACRGDCTLVRCADPDDSGAITASDALLALRAAVGVGVCEPSVCNVDGSPGGLSAVDALRILKLAAGVALETGCPPPPG